MQVFRRLDQFFEEIRLTGCASLCGNLNLQILVPDVALQEVGQFASELISASELLKIHQRERIGETEQDSAIRRGICLYNLQLYI